MLEELWEPIETNPEAAGSIPLSFGRIAVLFHRLIDLLPYKITFLLSAIWLKSGKKGCPT
jgi:hypothetical protein